MIGVRSRAWLVVGCLLAGGVIGGVTVNALQTVTTPRFLRTGLWSLGPEDVAQFTVTLDDHAAGPPALVRLEFLDEFGAVVKWEDVTLGAGHSTGLTLEGPGRYRAFARALDFTSTTSPRRAVVGTVNVLRATGDVDPTCSIVDTDGSNGGRN
jgi:hypothetical protein